MGSSSSKTKSEQEADVYLTQQFSGTCNVTCQNTMSHVTVDIINSTIGGSVILDQTCATDASCLIGSNMDATADVIFKASNSSNAKNAWSLWSMSPFNFDSASAESRQNIKESINQSSVETCNISSYNQMDNISIFAANSTIGGNISISQNASTQGQCQLENTMSAAAYATGTAQNKATSGKDKKGQKFGDKSAKLRLITYAVIGVVVIIIVTIIAKIISNSTQKSERSQIIAEMEAAKNISSECPYGTKPIFDPMTRRVVCSQSFIKPPPRIE